ncbi:MAG TPA: SPOR domain-containing protein [Methylomirabilota bacterium]|nr:SPOR domain-containing protein [Methylomirabilota bacterium]
MGTLMRRYTHVPLGVVSMLLIVVIIAWLLERRVDGVWDPALRIAAPVRAAVTIAPMPPRAPEAAAAPVEAPPERATAPAEAPVSPSASMPAPVEVTAPAPPAERYALESGPFTSAEAADRIEDQLNHLGYATVRFRKQQVRRHYVVAATGFPSLREARRAAAELGRGTVLEADDGLEVQVDTFPTLHEAIAAARALRGRGFEIRLDEDLSPTVIYHVRYGQFQSQAAAHARGEALALFGLTSRVVKVVR